MRQLAESVDTAIAVDGDRARMAYGPGLEVRLVREPDGWKIDDLD
jgi:hypothetical protein